MKKNRIIVDVMGGDNPASDLVKGAVEGARLCGAQLVLVGNKEELSQALGSFDAEIVEAAQTVVMTDEPAVSIREKSGSSMSVGCRLVAADEGDVLISCGNTGALYTAASHYVRCYKGLRRAALCAVVPLSAPVVLTDAGANPEADERALLSFAKLGEIYCKAVLDIESPRVALINNGAEAHKGTRVYRAAHELLRQSDMNFIGNIEGRDIPFGGCDVAVCDGFTGNVLIKTIEGMGGFVKSSLKEIVSAGVMTKLGGLMLKKELYRFMRGLDDSAYGGAPLLGISKPVMKIHGNANSSTVKSAVVQANRLVSAGLCEKMAEGVSCLQAGGVVVK